MQTSWRKWLTEFGLNPLDVHIPREEASDDIAPKDTQDSGETPSQAHDKFCRRSEPDLTVPCALSVRRRERRTSMEEGLDEVTNFGRVDVEGITKRKERGCETMCAVMVWTRWSTSSGPRTTWKGNSILAPAGGDL
jgi:hypothetical protein